MWDGEAKCCGGCIPNVGYIFPMGPYMFIVTSDPEGLVVVVDLPTELPLELESLDGVRLSGADPPGSSRLVWVGIKPLCRSALLGFRQWQKHTDTTLPTTTKDRNALTTITNGKYVGTVEERITIRNG